MELLQCNIVIVKPSEPKILRLNLKRNSRIAEPAAVLSGQHLAPTVQEEAESSNEQGGHVRIGPYPRLKASTPLSSPEEIMTPFTPSDPGTSSKSSSEASPCQASGHLVNNGSHMVRGSILEVAAAGIREKGASFRAFYPDINDGVCMPGMLTMECSPTSMLHKYKQGHLRSPTESSKPPTGM